MIVKSDLLIALLARCERDYGRITANTFTLEVLTSMANGVAQDNNELAKREDVMREVVALDQVFCDLLVNKPKVKEGLEKVVAKGERDFWDVALMNKIWHDFEREEAYANGKTVCVNDVIAHIFAVPTKAIKNIMTGVGANAEDEAVAVDADASATPPVVDPSQIERLKKRLQGQNPTFLADDDDEDDDDIFEDIIDMAQADDLFSDVTCDGRYKTPTLATVVQRTDAVKGYLSERIFGQDHAISTFVSGYFQAELSALTQQKRSKPRATFLFAGPPGVGKTYLAEQVAEVLKLPFMRFDMSEYADKEANIEFCGSDKVYKNGKEGNVTSFVSENPRCVLLFDEVEKAHLNVIYLFLQMLDAGRLRDNYTDEEVPFTDAIIIFTTNAGKRMYEDESINLSTVSRKNILRALGADINPITNSPLFPPAICSRFASGNVVMFNRMGADYLLRIAEREMDKQMTGIGKNTGLTIAPNALLPYVILFGEGGKADARTITGKSGSFVFAELYELFRLMNADNSKYKIENLQKIEFNVHLPRAKKIRSLFQKEGRSGVLVFADKATCSRCRDMIDSVDVYVASSVRRAKEVLEKHDISLILCDVACRPRGKNTVLNVADELSVGRDFFHYACERVNLPLYVLGTDARVIGKEELGTLMEDGAAGLVYLRKDEEYDLNQVVQSYTEKAYQRTSLLELTRANKVLRYKTNQSISKDGKIATIGIFDFALTTAVDAEDTGGIVDNVSRPDVRFSDIIGAEDAKSELSYFIEYLKNPAKYMRKGVKAPKGILLYGPPGTGKTMLAKALAGESDVTFIRAEGNQFLKRYVGEGSQSVHELFHTARKYAPSILFIDEIDAIAKERGGSNTENTGDVLTSFLTEMDGFQTDKDRPVFVLAATNYNVDAGTQRSLDAALLRRFDRRIYIDLPKKQERIAFIDYKLGKIENHAVSAAQRENLAIRSTGQSLADLDSVFEMALRNLIKTEELVLTDAILEDAFETYQSGDKKTWNKDELLRTAYHEAGHALLCWISGEKPSYLTVVARGSHGGYMQYGDTESKGTYTKPELLARVRTALAGRAAEIVFYGYENGVSTGPSADLRSATNTVRSMICSYGMDETVGLGCVDLTEVAGSPYYAQIMERVNQQLAQQLQLTVEIVQKNKKAVQALVEALMERNALKEDEIDGILKQNYQE